MDDVTVTNRNTMHVVI